MRRPKPRDDEPSKAWRVPWWRTCKACGWRFLFEHSWAGRWHLGFEAPRHGRNVWSRGHVCLECAPTKEGARKYFGVIRPRRPDGPPPPPPPRPTGGPVPPVIALPLSGSCPTCGSGVGEVCRSASGDGISPSRCHAARGRATA